MKTREILFYLVFFLMALHTCHNSTGPSDGDDDTGNNFSITEAQGPGGPAYLRGNINDYVHPGSHVSKVDLFIMDSHNYADTISHVFIDSENGSFKITELPETTVDLIFFSENYLTAKIGKMKLKPAENSFHNPYSSGFFIDSTVYMTNIADSVGRPDAPDLGLQGYGLTIIVHFKWETSDSLAFEMVKASGCDTLAVYRYDDPVFDPFENDVYYLRCPNVQSVPNKLQYFNWLEGVKRAGPGFLVIES